MNIAPQFNFLSPFFFLLLSLPFTKEIRKNPFAHITKILKLNINSFFYPSRRLRENVHLLSTTSGLEPTRRDAGKNEQRETPGHPYARHRAHDSYLIDSISWERRADRMFRLRARRDGIVAAHTDGRFNGMCKRMFYKPTKIRHGTRTGIIGDSQTLSSITDRAAVIFGRARRAAY